MATRKTSSVTLNVWRFLGEQEKENKEKGQYAVSKAKADWVLGELKYCKALEILILIE